MNPYKYYGGQADLVGPIVAKEVRSGRLPSAKDFACVDCGHGATEYDHRDYNLPLEVEPVCQSCNLLRGPAIPLNGWIRKKMRRGWVPYKQRGAVIKLLKIMKIKCRVLHELPPTLGMEHWKMLVKIHPELVADRVIKRNTKPKRKS